MAENGGRFDFMKTVKFGIGAAVLAAVGLLAVAGWYYSTAKPEYDRVMLRARATQDLFALYDLQLRYKAATAAYADDLEALLRSAPDGGAALRKSLQEHTHPDTLVVAGDAEKFKLEANVRDPERTLLRVKGPRAGDRK